MHKFLVLIDSASFCQPPAAEVDAFSQLSCCAFEGNPLGLRAGEPFTLSLTFAESTVRANLGIAITDVGAFAVHANAEASQEPLKKKARSKMELWCRSRMRRATYIQILNRENSMRTPVAWLDKYNSELGQL